MFFCLLIAATNVFAQDFPLRTRNFAQIKNLGFDLPTTAKAERYATVGTKEGENVTFYVTAFDNAAAMIWQIKIVNPELDVSGNLLTVGNGDKTLYLWGTPKQDRTTKNKNLYAWAIEFSF